jgi:hypothetical protein
MGAAIPHMMLLVTSLPLILPFPREEVHIDSRTHTVDCIEELVPDDEDEDLTYRVKGRSAISVLIRIGKEPVPALFTGVLPQRTRPKQKKRGKGRERGKGKEAVDDPLSGEVDDDIGMPIRRDSQDDGEQDDGIFVYDEGSQAED